MNYKIEGGLNFLDEIKEQQSSNNDNDNDKCLLSGEKIELNSITLPCNHTFNYTPLLSEIKEQKLTTNFLETSKLKIFQIKCPYCRQITNNLLPQIPNDKNVIMQLKGVNAPQKYCLQHRTCSWIFKYGNNKDKSCSKSAYDCNLGTYCNSHRKKLNKKEKPTSEMKDEFQKYKVVELRKMLKERGLKVSGNKKYLITRLKKHISENIISFV